MAGPIGLGRRLGRPAARWQAGDPGRLALPACFIAALFTSALLLFLVQPMIGKLILPRLGGAPAVWNTCMVFFQTALLAGYLYAHLGAAWLGPRRLVLVHASLLLVPLFFLPIGLAAEASPPADANPVLWLLGVLAATAGVPFVVVATTAPLLQRWFAETGHPSAKDPYFLYAASNLGSLTALVAYPLLIEPALELSAQAGLWATCYGLLVLLVVLCGWLTWRAAGVTATTTDDPADAVPSPTWGQRLRWVGLAFIPSSLLLGVTTYLSTDIAPIPLLWVVPLGLYLLTFVLAFAALPDCWHRLVVRLTPLAMALLFFMVTTGYKPPMLLLIGLHLSVFFVIAWSAHNTLARSRPGPQHLTGFYLWMSLGGVLGGLCNALAAPWLFKTLAEYALVAGLACLLLPRVDLTGRWRWLRLPGVALPLLAAGVAAIALTQMLGGFNPGRVARFVEGMYFRSFDGLFDLGRVGNAIGVSPVWLVRLGGVTLAALVLGYLIKGRKEWLTRVLDLVLPAAVGVAAVGLVLVWRTDFWQLERLGESMAGRSGKLLAYGIPLLLCLTLSHRPVRFGLGLAAVVFAGSFYDSLYGTQAVYRERSFFGTLCVEYRGDDHSLNLYHGTTLHGKQFRDPAKRRDALTYYHSTGPIGQVFGSYTGPGAKPPVGVIGLGSGTLASYGQPGQRLTFYEIDPAVERIACQMGLFTYVPDARERGVDVRVVLGDARLRLQESEANEYGLIVIDAFSSDAIPTHLITREALAIYRAKLAEGGLIAFHVSNRYLDLEPVLVQLADDAGMVGLVQNDEDDRADGKAASSWVVLARRPADFQPLAVHHRKKWGMLTGAARVGLWTDSYSNLLSVFK